VGAPHKRQSWYPYSINYKSLRLDAQDVYSLIKRTRKVSLLRRTTTKAQAIISSINSRTGVYEKRNKNTAAINLAHTKQENKSASVKALVFTKLMTEKVEGRLAQVMMSSL